MWILLENMKNPWDKQLFLNYFVGFLSYQWNNSKEYTVFVKEYIHFIGHLCGVFYDMCGILKV